MPVDVRAIGSLRMKSLLAVVVLMACLSWTAVAWSADEGVAI